MEEFGCNNCHLQLFYNNVSIDYDSIGLIGDHDLCVRGDNTGINNVLVEITDQFLQEDYGFIWVVTSSVKLNLAGIKELFNCNISAHDVYFSTLKGRQVTRDISYQMADHSRSYFGPYQPMIFGMSRNIALRIKKDSVSFYDARHVSHWGWDLDFQLWCLANRVDIGIVDTSSEWIVNSGAYTDEEKSILREEWSRACRNALEDIYGKYVYRIISLLKMIRNNKVLVTLAACMLRRR